MQILWRSRLLMSFWLILLAVSPVLGQIQRGAGLPRQVAGHVRNARSGVPIVGAMVELQSEAGEAIEQAFVGSGGRFEFRDLRPRRYYLVARAAGYRPSFRIAADVTSMPQQSVEIALQPSSDAAAEQQARPGGLVGKQSLAIPTKAQQEFMQAQESLGKKGDPSAAIAHLQKAMGVYPEYVEAHHLLGTLYMDQGKWPEAEKSLRRAVELNNRFAPAYFALGALFNKQHKPKEAVDTLSKGLQLQPNFWPGHVEISQAYFSLGDRQHAKEHALRAHELRPEAAITHLILADTYVAENSYKEAKREYEHFLERAPKSPWTSKIEEQIRQLDRVLGHPPKASPAVAPK